MHTRTGDRRLVHYNKTFFFLNDDLRQGHAYLCRGNPRGGGGGGGTKVARGDCRGHQTRAPSLLPISPPRRLLPSAPAELLLAKSPRLLLHAPATAGGRAGGGDGHGGGGGGSCSRFFFSSRRRRRRCCCCCDRRSDTTAKNAGSTLLCV